MCRAHISVYNLRDTTGSRLVTPEVGTIFGSVFVQHGGLGCASYHFDAENDCYISYDSAPDNWRCDDGSRPPAKKPWKEAFYEAETLTFHGVIEWDTPFAGDSKWVYRIVFAEDFVAVVGGEVICTATDGSTHIQKFSVPWEDNWDHNLAYLRWTPPSTTIFGSVYVQGPMYNFFLEGIASYHFDAEDDCYISYFNAPSEWCLADGSSPPRKKPFTNTSFDADTRTFRGVVSWDPLFAGAARWEYVITFSDDFSCICGGSMLPYGPDGAKQRFQYFADPRQWQQWPRVRGDLCYVQKPPVLTMSAQLRAQMPASETLHLPEEDDLSDSIAASAGAGAEQRSSNDRHRCVTGEGAEQGSSNDRRRCVEGAAEESGNVRHRCVIS